MGHPAEDAPLTVRELHDVLGRRIGIATLYDAIRAREIESVRVGKRILIPASEVDRLLGRKREQ